MKRALVMATCLVALGQSVSMATEANVYYPSYQDGSANVYTYHPHSQYEINTKIGYVTDIELRANEYVQKIATGDSTQWLVDLDRIGDVEHVYIKPKVKGITTNMVINTNERSYRFLVNSNDNVEYVVKFRFPELEKKAAAEERRKAWEEERSNLLKQQLLFETEFNRNYEVKKIKNVKKVYMPKQIFDDGKKTYVEISDESLRDNLPTLYVFDTWHKGKLQLVNYRIRGSVLELDQVVGGIRVLFAPDSYLDVENQAKSHTMAKKKDFKQIGNPIDTLEVAEKAVTPIALHSQYVSLKERLEEKRLKRLQEIEKRETEAFDESTSPSNEAAIDSLIQTVAASIMPDNSNIPEETSISPKIQEFIDREYGGERR